MKEARLKMNQRGTRKVREGVVTSNRMQKGVVVSIERMVMHPQYKKYLKRRTKLKAHDEKNECQIGDRVLIVECRPLSREKRWHVSQILKRAVQPEEETESKAARRLIANDIFYRSSSPILLVLLAGNLPNEEAIILSHKNEYKQAMREEASIP